MMGMITIDGSMGEGGGQVLRTSLSLSLVTGAGVRFVNLRAGRKKPGLLRQHLACVEAARIVGDAEVKGAELGSRELLFRPRALKGVNCTFSVGTAGSACLVFQTVLPALLFAKEPSSLVLEGGTHNPMAPPFEFLAETFLLQLARMGAKVTVALSSAGFYPAGGGRFQATIEPVTSLERLDLEARGGPPDVSIRALVANLPWSIGERELRAARSRLELPDAPGKVVVVPSPGPGNALLVVVEGDRVREIFAAFGEKGTSAENVARRAAGEARRVLEAGVPVGEYLADQLLVPMALGSGGILRTVKPSLHTETQLALLPLFLPIEPRVTRAGEDEYILEISRK